MRTTLFRLLGYVLVWSAALASSACDESPVQPLHSATVSGTVSYRERIALSENARVDVSLADVSTQDAPGIVIAQTSFAAAGRQVPLPFVISYDPTRIDANRAYALHATIRSEGQLLFTSDTVVRVVTEGYPSWADLVLVRVAR